MSRLKLFPETTPWYMYISTYLSLSRLYCEVPRQLPTWIHPDCQTLTPPPPSILSPDSQTQGCNSANITNRMTLNILKPPNHSNMNGEQIRVLMCSHHNGGEVRNTGMCLIHLTTLSWHSPEQYTCTKRI